MRPRAPRRGPRNVNFNALSPPSDVSLTSRVEAFSTDHQVCHRVPLFFTTAGQARPVEEVAKELVGYFLICRESNVVMRIVETEAYQEGEEIHGHRFHEPPRSPAGSLVSWTTSFNQQLMFITAGDDDSADLVFLRTCNPVHGNREIANRVNLVFPITQFQRINMITGPSNVSMALAPELGRDCNLLSPSSGLYLLQKDPNPLIMLDGPRILPRDTLYTSYSAMRGADSRFRFAFDCDQTLILRTNLRRIENQP